MKNSKFLRTVRKSSVITESIDDPGGDRFNNLSLHIFIINLKVKAMAFYGIVGLR